MLIYLLLAEHDIELVADRDLNQHVSHEEWQSIVKRLSFALLVQYFPHQAGSVNSNTLPNSVVFMT